MVEKQKSEGANIADPMLPRPFTIEKTRRDTYDTFTLELKAAKSKDGFTFAAGQFNMLYVFGIGEVPISISGDPAKPEMLIHTTRAAGTVTRQMKKLKKGDSLGVRGPYGSYWPVTKSEGNDLVIVAGGIGMAPLRPVIYQALASRNRYGKVILIYGARSTADLLYKRELENWRLRHDFEVHVTIDRGDIRWKGNVGVVTTLIPKVVVDLSHTVAMVCGPEIMMRYSIMELMAKGLGSDKIFVSMERNMKCGVGLCGHCQHGPSFVCKDGPVYRYDHIKDWMHKREL